MNAQMQRKYTKPVQIKTSQANMLRCLVANLMDIPTPPELVAAGVPQYPSNRIPEMGNSIIDPFYLATAEVEDGEPGENLRDQATVLRIIYALVADSGRPTPEAIRERLALELAGKQVENAAEVAHDLVERVKFYRSLPPDVEFLATALAGWTKRRWIRSRLADMMALVDSPSDDHEVTLALLELMRDITPDTTPMSETSYADNIKYTRGKIREAFQRRQQGKSRGPEYPWASLRELVPIIQPGHMHVWSAPTKQGKTTFANEMGRYIALNQPEYMVVLYHLETDALDLGMREMARELTIKPGDMMNGMVNIDDPGWAAKLAEQDQFLAERVGTGKYAKYKYVHCPSLTLQALEKDLYRQKTIAAAMGWEGVVVIIDYYQIMDWQASIPKAKDEIAGRNEMASKLKDLIERANKPAFGSCDVTVHGIVFAQDNVFDAGRKTPFGGQQIIQRGQVQIQIIGMDDVEGNEPVWTTAKNRNDQVQKVDGLGNPLFFHTVGDVHSDRAIHVVRGNQVKPGYAFVQMVNGYFNIFELNHRKPMWWPEYRDKMAKRKKRSS